MTGFPSGEVTVSGGTVVWGGALERDTAARIKKIDLAGVVSHGSSYTYDKDRGWLRESILVRPDEKLSSVPPTIDSFVPADFLTLHEAPSALSTAQNQKLGEKAWSIEPATWSASRQTGSRIGTLTLSLPGLDDLSRTFQYTGGRRTSDGVWTYTWDDFERLTAMENPSTARRIEFRYDTNGRVISRTAFRTDGIDPLLEDRGDILAKDGLPADTTFVWDPIADRLVAIFEGRQTLVPGGPKAYDGLLRQMLHGDQGYDDPVEVLKRVGGSSAAPEVEHLYPVVDHSGTGSLQAVLGADGNLIERVLYGSAWGAKPKYLQGPLVENAKLEAEKDGSGNLTKVTAEIRLTEKIAESSLPGMVIHLLKADGSEAAGTTGTLTVDSKKPNVLLWTMTGAEWQSWTAASGAATLEIAVTDQLRAEAWGETPVMPAPEWAPTLYGVKSSASQPWQRRESLATLATELFDKTAAGATRDREIYDIPDLYLAASSDSKTQLLTGFHAYPFTEPASGLVYLRARWYDPGTGSFLSPDPLGYQDSSNLYAFCGGDPVNCSDPTGNAGVKKGSISYPDNPLPGETREQYVTRLTKSGQVSFMDAAMMGECYFTSQCGSARITEIAQQVDTRVKAQAKLMLTMEAVGVATVFTGGAAGGLVTTYGGGTLLATTIGGAVGGAAGQGTADLIRGKRSSGADYAQSALLGIGGAYIGGAVMGGVDPGPLTIFKAPVRSFPTLTFRYSETPGIAANIETAQQSGTPSTLSRATNRSLIRANRRVALRGQTAPGSGLSLDEYPFASTYQGGSGAQVAAVPVHEQNVQGGKLSIFYQEHAIGEGDWFHVVIKP